MGKTSTVAKDKWNKANYTPIKVDVRPEIAESFKAACMANNVSMRSELSEFMAAKGGVGTGQSRHKKDLLASRSGRRELLLLIVKQLEQVIDAEERYRDAIPENLQGSIRYENAEQSILTLEEALEILSSAY